MAQRVHALCKSRKSGIARETKLIHEKLLLVDSVVFATPLDMSQPSTPLHVVPTPLGHTANTAQPSAAVRCGTVHHCLANLRVVIVGGGTAGWMTAATLQRRLACEITVIESARIAPIGVGEATIPSMVDWLENMQIDERRFLQQTSGTYKLAIRFDNWITAKHRYWHPFGLAGITIDQSIGIIFGVMPKPQAGAIPRPLYSDYCLQHSFVATIKRRGCSAARHPYQITRFIWMPASLPRFLQSVAINDGARHCVGDVTGAERNVCGDIVAIHVQINHPCPAIWLSIAADSPEC